MDSVIDQHINTYMKNFPQKGDDNFLQRQKSEWQHQRGVMLRVFKTMEKRAPVEFKRAMNSWYKGTSDIPATSEYTREDQPPTEGLNYQHGMPFYGSSKLLRCYVTEQGGEVCINFRSLHLKMLLLSTTKPKPENYTRSTAVKTGPRGDKVIRPDTYMPLPGPNEYVEPRYSVKSIPDGMSDPLNPRMARSGMKELGIPPIIRIGDEANFDRHNINLGRKHLAKSGQDIMQLLEWAEQTDWPRQALIQLDEAYRGGRMYDETAEVYRTLSEGTFGSDVFQYFMDMYGSDPKTFLEQHIQRGLGDQEDRSYGTEEESSFPVNDRSLGLLRKHGPAISALMDFLYALMHRASNTSVKIQDKGGAPRTINTFGQQYDGTSGAGGGGEVMMSIKFAYEAKMEQVGSPEATKRWKESIPGHDPRVRQKDVLFRQTDPTNVGVEPTRQELDEGATPDMVRPHIVEHLSFWVGQSSTAIMSGGYRSPRMTTLWPQQGFQGKSWSEALDYFYLRYPQIGEETGEVIFDIGINLGALEKRISESYDKVRQELEMENSIAITTEFGTTEIGAMTGEEEIPIEEMEGPPTPVEPVAPAVPVGAETPSPPPTPEVPAPNVPETPVPSPAPDVAPKSMPAQPTYQAPQSDYIGKSKNKRTLIKSKNRLNAESLVDRISKVATQFDQRGEKDLANSLDALLNQLTKENQLITAK